MNIITKRLAFLIITGCLQICSAQVQVILSPPPKLQFFDQGGRPLAFGCVFTYASGTTTPLATYTDFSGNTQNTNPVVLNAGGFSGGGSSGIWLQAGQAYTFRVISQGGTNCASGQTQYTVDGIGGGGASVTTVVTFSPTPTFVIQGQAQLFEMTLTGNAAANPLSAVGVIPPALIIFQLTQDVVGGHTFAWPANVIGGAPIGLGANQVTTQMFVWNGVTATAIGPATTGSGPQLSSGNINANGNVMANAVISSSANPAGSGAVRLASGDAACWRNNANSSDACMTKSPSDNLVYPNGFALGGGTPLASTNQSGTGLLCLTINCASTTPLVNGVRLFGTPPTGGYQITSLVVPALTLTQAIRQTAQSFTQTGGMVTTVSMASSTMTVNGVFAGGASNGYQKWTFTLGGFTNSGNNGTFVCSSSTGTTLVFINAGGINETAPATALVTSSVNTTDYIGTITNGISNAYAGYPPFTVSGFVSSGNNGNFSPIASTATVLAVTNAGGVNETDPATANTADAVLANWQINASFNTPQRIVLSSPNTVTINTQTIILSESVTFPSATGTYRADVRYGMWVTVGPNLCVAEAIDTTNNRAFALSGHNSNGSGFIGMAASEISPQTYAPSAVATFTLQIVCNTGATVTVNSGAFPGIVPSEPTYLEVTPILSN